MADLKKHVSDVLSQVMPIFQVSSVSPAEKDKALGLIHSLLREMGQRTLCDQMLSVKEKFEKMLSVWTRFNASRRIPVSKLQDLKPVIVTVKLFKQLFLIDFT